MSRIKKQFAVALMTATAYGCVGAMKGLEKMVDAMEYLAVRLPMKLEDQLDFRMEAQLVRLDLRCQINDIWVDLEEIRGMAS